MEIVGYVAYASLVILAIVWTIDVRTHLGADTSAILRAVYFISAAVLIPAFSVNMGHCLWVAPFGCLFSRVIAPLLIKTPILSLPFIVTADVFERIVRAGIPRSKIQEAQSTSMCAAADERR